MQNAKHHALPASPFDLPAPNLPAPQRPTPTNLYSPYHSQMPLPATSTSAMASATGVGKLDSFSFQKGAVGGGRMGEPPHNASESIGVGWEEGGKGVYV